MKRVYLLTDFGYRDYYVAAMKSVILDLYDDVLFIDVSHDVQPGNVLQGGFILWQLSLVNVHNSVIVGVVDPGVGTERRALLVECSDNNVLIGPDNGLLSPLMEALGIEAAYEIDYSRSDYFPRVSHTFHGRDVFARAAGLYLRGVREFLRPLDEYVRMDIFRYRKDGNRVYFKVVNVDRFGNIVTNVSCQEALLPIKVVLSGKEQEVRRVKTFSDLGQGEVGVICGSSGLYEVVCNGSSAAEYLGVDVGDEGIFITG